MKRTLLSLSLLTLLNQCLFAQAYNTQQGYIVTYENDTIPGLIKEQHELSEKILFKPDRSTHFRSYSPDDINMFYYEGGYYYKALQVPVQDDQNQRLFLLSLVEGYLSLYKGQDYFYVAKGNGPLARLEQRDTIIKNYKRKDKRYIRLLNYLTSDCPILQDKLEKIKLTPSDLIKFITAYNHCIDPEADTRVNAEATKLKLHTGFRIGSAVSKNKYILEGEIKRNYDFKAEVGYTAGMFFNLSYNDKASLQPEVLITKKGGAYQTKLNNLHNEYANFSLTYLQLPISIYYTWPTQGIRPFISAGGVLGYTLSNNSYLDISGRKLDIALDKDEYGYRAGAGLSYVLNNRRRLSIEYIWERSLTNGIDSYRQAQFVIHNITMSIRF